MPPILVRDPMAGNADLLLYPFKKPFGFGHDQEVIWLRGN